MHITRTTLVSFCVGLALTPALPAATNIYYSIDIGSDLEFSDPNADGDEILDPGDIYGVTLGQPQNRELAKNDLLIFSPVDPPPSSTANKVPVGNIPYNPQLPAGFFDLDGEDQLELFFETLNGPVPKVTVGNGLYLNPDLMVFSYDDDQAPGWYRNNVPVTVPPDRGPGRDELLHGIGWFGWGAGADLPYASEADLGLAPDPVMQKQDDDDVDALDLERHSVWYWTSDHEATYGTDPGDIYVTRVGPPATPGYSLAIDNLVLGVPNGTDVDGFEFCATDDPAILAWFGLSAANAPYLAVVFSVDEDDLDTAANESGGLSPDTLYISLLTGLMPGPLALSKRDADVDAIAFGETEKDWGDAPESGSLYPTTLSRDGARHRIVAGMFLGALIDSEADGQPTPSADGDDIAFSDDEDGVVFTSALYQGQLASVTVTASKPGLLSAWINFNLANGWNDASDQIFADLPLAAGTNYLTFTVPSIGAAAAYQTFARFRYSTQAGLTPTGLAQDGEVEDYKVSVQPHPDEGGLELDFGDAADPSYPTLRSSNGARHVAATPYFLGALVDAEPDGQPLPPAKGDDLGGVDDEDGVVFTDPLVRGSNVLVNVTASTVGFLNAWVDFNADGDWADVGERVAAALRLNPGANAVPVSVPLTARLGPSTSRFRFSSLSAPLTATGFAADGEVEDYAVTLFQPAPSQLVITSIVQVAASRVRVSWSNEPNILYQLQCATNLATGSVWSLIDSIVGGTLTDTAAVETSKFYRVVAPYTP